MMCIPKIHHLIMYNDNTQFRDSCHPDDTDTLRSRLSRCADGINSWCKSRRLQLNANKTEATWVGSGSNLAKIANSDCSVQANSSKIQSSAVVRDLGLHQDSELFMKHIVAKVAATCHYHLRRLRQIRRRVGQEVTTTRLVLSMVVSRLDYCNAALAGLPQATVAPLQRVQNSAACLIFKLSSREHVTPCLLQLHWLPVRWRVQLERVALCSLFHMGRVQRI